ncbi:MAG TPA: DUF4388 domain-containing protein [Ktedonobacteraceae bacterium]|nr:DUF4388 domain-containing protein [Ktedonobacteraceae bacterium]
MSQQEIATDRLVSVIQSIQMAQWNGVLTVRRGEGATLEEGSIVFVNGQVKQTAAGRRSGTNALNWLSTWGQCRYIFASSDARQTQPLNTIPAAGGNNMRPITRELETPIPSLPAEKLAEPLLPISGSTWERRPPSSSSQEANIFHPTQSLEIALRGIEQNRFSRSHRQLFLLIDGKRSEQELARLAGKNQQELQVLLRDLERIGVIRPGGN